MNGLGLRPLLQQPAVRPLHLLQTHLELGDLNPCRLYLVRHPFELSFALAQLPPQRSFFGFHVLPGLIFKISEFPMPK